VPEPTESARGDIDVRVGVAGWDYPDWRGRVYPPRVPAGFDRLAWVADFVEVVEVNATFYRPVSPGTAESWIRRTAAWPRFRFTAKAHRSWTHESDADPGPAIDATLRGLSPLRDAGRLSAVLVQFPQRVHRTDGALRRIEAIARRTRGWPITVEVRHRSWESEEVLTTLRDLGVGWCVVDQPEVAGACGAVVATTSRLAYLRLHGRNRRDWFREGAGRDARYDYLYLDDELDALERIARRLGRTADSVVVIQNNHFRGQAMVNALQLRRRLEGVRPRAPEPLVQAFPPLARDCTTKQSRLF
jgi:uncharacterized protein YecE (DUF72 family)